MHYTHTCMYMYIHIYAHVYIICIYSYNSFFVLVFNFIKYEFKSSILNYDNIGKSIIMKYYTVYNLLRPMFFTKLYNYIAMSTCIHQKTPTRMCIVCNSPKLESA